jgi:hypothetical protein
VAQQHSVLWLSNTKFCGSATQRFVAQQHNVLWLSNTAFCGSATQRFVAQQHNVLWLSNTKALYIRIIFVLVLVMLWYEVLV